MKKLLWICASVLLLATSCISGEGGGSATPEGFTGNYTTYEIDDFNGEIIDTILSDETSVKVEIPDILKAELDFTFLGIKFAVLMPKLAIKVPSLAYTTESSEEGGIVYKVDVESAVPMLGDIEREDYTMRNIKASIGRTIEFQFELQKKESIYRVVFSNR